MTIFKVRYLTIGHREHRKLNVCPYICPRVCPLVFPIVDVHIFIDVGMIIIVFVIINTSI